MKKKKSAADFRDSHIDDEEVNETSGVRRASSSQGAEPEPWTHCTAWRGSERHSSDCSGPDCRQTQRAQTPASSWHSPSLHTYSVSSRWRPNGCLAQGVSVSGSESGLRSWLVAADAKAQTCKQDENLPQTRPPVWPLSVLKLFDLWPSLRLCVRLPALLLRSSDTCPECRSCSDWKQGKISGLVTDFLQIFTIKVSKLELLIVKHSNYTVTNYSANYICLIYVYNQYKWAHPLVECYLCFWKLKMHNSF